MRCYFLRAGHIAAFEELTELSEEQATAKAHALFAERRHLFEGFEVWDGPRVLIGHPQPESTSANAVGICRWAVETLQKLHS
jgi:hypothetical protein